MCDVGAGTWGAHKAGWPGSAAAGAAGKAGSAAAARRTHLDKHHLRVWAVLHVAVLVAGGAAPVHAWQAGSQGVRSVDVWVYVCGCGCVGLFEGVGGWGGGGGGPGLLATE